MKEIPDSLAELTTLTHLYLRSNQIKEIPENLERLKHLKQLDVRQNLLPIASEILGPPTGHKDLGPVSEIFNYCRQLRSGDVKPLNE
ncbi:MAG: hypothetical protein F6K31_38965, partial [Symploca sp. SIO2G7]|nr:hypothetical protein [Symploca sp. SIO2G7]